MIYLIPNLETNRLRLRKFKESDLDDLFSYAKSPNVGPKAEWKPHENKAESLKILNSFINEGEVWAIVSKESIYDMFCYSMTKNEWNYVANKL